MNNADEERKTYLNHMLNTMFRFRNVWFEKDRRLYIAMSNEYNTLEND